MKLELLLKREDFYKIFAETLSNYLIKYQNWTGSIYISSKRNKTAKNLFINKRLNLIYTDSCSPADLRKLSQEYSYHKNFFKRSIQKLYIFLSLSNLLRVIFSNGFIVITGPITFQKFCILPGNHSIRIIDLDRSYSLVLTKSGEKEDYLERIISVRTKHNKIPGPKILDWNLDDGWYKEEIIHSLPINRMNENEIYMHTLKRAEASMQKIYEETLREDPFCEWKENLTIKFQKMIEKFPKNYQETLIKDIEEIYSKILHKLNEQFTDTSLIYTVQSHGDFQEANILLSTNNTQDIYIIDWEYSSRRYVYYDLLVLKLKARSPKGLSDRMIAFIYEKFVNEIFLKNFFKDSNLINGLRDHIYVFLLEDLLFRIEDSLDSSSNEPSEAIFNFVEEILLFFKHQDH